MGMACMHAASVNTCMPEGAVEGTIHALNMTGSTLGAEPGTEACRLTVLACIASAILLLDKQDTMKGRLHHDKSVSCSV